MADELKRGTEFKRIELYRDRWSSYGANTGVLEISEKLNPAALKKFEIFSEFDDKFLEKISPDVSVARWKRDTVLFEEGSYIDIAFAIAKGTVDVFLQKQQGGPGPIFDLSRTIIAGRVDSPSDNFQAGRSQTVFQAQVERQNVPQRGITFLSAMDIDLPTGARVSLGPGEIFGEIGALSGWPQSVTAKTTSECELIQIRVSALRLMRKSKSLKARLDKLYRERSLFAQLKATPLFRACDDAFIRSLTQSVELVSLDPDEIITREGEAADAFYMVRSGFVKLAQRLGEGQIVVSYLSKGMSLGEFELLSETNAGWIYEASSKEFSELVKISADDFRRIVKQFPGIESMLWQSTVARLKEAGYSRKNIQQSEFIETALDGGLVEGNSILVIDLNRCTRCDDCVRGCAETHGGIPRFVREGEKYRNFLITRACYHCEDPVCLVGCPTGAIRRAAVGDVVEIVDSICIGCQTCANKCPYDAITMFDLGKVWPDDMIPEGLRGKQAQLATKCDLCYKSEEGPACVNSCPHACAMRIGDIGEFKKLIAKET